MENKYFGKICDKHPERKGERYKQSRTCIGCNHDARKRRAQDPDRMARFNEQRRENRAYIRHIKAEEQKMLRDIRIEAQMMAMAAGAGSDNWRDFYVQAKDKLGY